MSRPRLTSLTAVLAIAALPAALGIGCAPEATPRELDVGAHRFSVDVPPGWEVVDLGQQVFLRSGPNQLAIVDLGPIRDERTRRPLEPAEVEAIQERGLDSLAEVALEELGHDRRMDVERRRTATIDGRKGLVLDTWNRLTHARHRRVAVIVDGGAVLAVRTDQGRWEEITKALDELLATLRFAPPAESKRE